MMMFRNKHPSPTTNPTTEDEAQLLLGISSANGKNGKSKHLFSVTKPADDDDDADDHICRSRMALTRSLQNLLTPSSSDIPPYARCTRRSPICKLYKFLPSNRKLVSLIVFFIVLVALNNLIAFKLPTLYDETRQKIAKNVCSYVSFTDDQETSCLSLILGVNRANSYATLIKDQTQCMCAFPKSFEGVPSSPGNALSRTSEDFQRFYRLYGKLLPPNTFLPFSPAWNIPFEVKEKNPNQIVTSDPSVGYHRKLELLPHSSSDSSSPLQRQKKHPYSFFAHHSLISVPPSFNMDIYANQQCLLSMIYGEPFVFIAPVVPDISLPLALQHVYTLSEYNSTQTPPPEKFGYRVIIDPKPPHGWSTSVSRFVCTTNYGAYGRLDMLYENEIREKLLQCDAHYYAEGLMYWLQQDQYVHPTLITNQYTYDQDEPWILSVDAGVGEDSAIPEDMIADDSGFIDIDEARYPWFYHHAQSCMFLARQIREVKFATSISHASLTQGTHFEKGRVSVSTIKQTTFNRQKIYAHMYWSNFFIHPQAMLAIRSFLATQDLDRYQLIMWIDRPFSFPNETNPTNSSTSELVIPPELYALLLHPAFSSSFAIRYYNSTAELLKTPLRDNVAFYGNIMDNDLHWSDSDLFRLVIMYIYGGIYFDADVVILRDLAPLLHQEWLYRWEATCAEINGAVAYFRAQSPVSTRMINALRNITPGKFNWGNVLYTKVYSEMVAENSPDIFTILPPCFFDPLWGSGDFYDTLPGTPSQWNGAFAYHLHGRVFKIEDLDPQSDYMRVQDIVMFRLKAKMVHVDKNEEIFESQDLYVAS